MGAACSGLFIQSGTKTEEYLEQLERALRVKITFFFSRMGGFFSSSLVQYLLFFFFFPFPFASVPSYVLEELILLDRAHVCVLT